MPPPDAVFWIAKLPAVAIGTTIAAHATGHFPPAAVAGCLALQLGRRRPPDWTYWVATVLAGAVGTLVADGLVGARGVGPARSWAVGLSVSFAATFATWHALEGDVSMRSIIMARREAFHWLAIGLAFALGRVIEALAAQFFSTGHLVATVAFGAASALAAFAHARRWLDPAVVFWTAYLLTCPLGASFANLLRRDGADGGLGLGPSADESAVCQRDRAGAHADVTERRVRGGPAGRDRSR